MLSSSLEKLEKILTKYEKKLNNEQMKKLDETLIYFKGGIIPAKVLKRELGISFKDTHNLMSFLATQGILKPKYRVICENDCFTGAGKIYEYLSEIPIKICDRCDKGCMLLEHISVEFEVLDNER